MRIVTVSTSDLGHGAGIAAYRLHRALLDAGLDATMLVSEKLSADPTVIGLLPPPTNTFRRLLQKSALVCERLLNVCGPQNLYSVADRALLDQLLKLKPDVIHLHNIHWHSRNLSLSLPARLGKLAPVVWTFHDMWPLTGHCLYSRDCDRWQTECGSCPYLRAYPGLLVDTSRLQCLLKKRIYRSGDFTVVTPSQWLGDFVKRSPLLSGRRALTIPNSIDDRLFLPADKSRSRLALGIQDVDKPVLLFATAQLDNELKGYRYFEESLLRLPDRYTGKLNLIVVGEGSVGARLKERFAVTALGYLKDQELMARIYSAADLYVMPSVQDNLPSVVLESFACGTPVICFDTGGLPEMVRHGVTGYVAKQRDVEDLTRWVEVLLDDAPLRLQMGRAARRVVESDYSPRVQAQRCRALYRELLGRPSAGRQ